MLSGYKVRKGWEDVVFFENLLDEFYECVFMSGCLIDYEGFFI